MKIKAFVALSIALVMLLTLVAPVLAAGPNRLTLSAVSPETGTGTATLRTTHDNQCKVSIVLEGATPYKQYQVWVDDGTAYHWAGTLATYADGNERFSGATQYTFPTGLINCRVVLERSDLLGTVYVTNSIELTFR